MTASVRSSFMIPAGIRMMAAAERGHANQAADHSQA